MRFFKKETSNYLHTCSSILLVCAIAYSNLQRNYLTPAYVLGILIDEFDLLKIKQIKSKEDFQPTGTNLVDPYDLTEIESEIKKYSPLIKDQKLLQFPTNEFKSSPLKLQELDSAFKTIINKLIHENISVTVSSVREIRLHDFYENTESLNIHTTSLLDFFSESKIKTIIENKPEFSPAMQLTRLQVWKEYLATRRNDIRLARTFIKNNSNKNFFHILGMRWPYVRLEAYANSSVGFPYLIIKHDHEFINSPLNIGTKVSFFPFAKSCIGKFDADTETNFCRGVKGSPYGALLAIDSNDVHCKKCGTAVDKLKFGAKGINTLTTDEKDPLEGYRDDPHYVYITRFASKLKVGRARLSRGLARLLEQSCADAIVIFPLLSFDHADEIEKKITEQLKSNLHYLKKYGIENVSERASFDDKLNMIKQWNQKKYNVNNELYDEVIKIIRQNSYLDSVVEMTENKIINCTSNWQLDSNLDLNKTTKINSYWTHFEGEIQGITGTLLFINDMIIDMERFQGCLYKGNGFE